MVDKLPDVWLTRDLPTLIAASRRVDRGLGARVEDITQDTGLSQEDTKAALRALHRRRLVVLAESTRLGGSLLLGVSDITSEAYVITGLHPDSDNTVTRLIEAIDQAIARVDPDERPRLRKLRDSAGAVSRDTLSAIIAAAVVGAGGL